MDATLSATPTTVEEGYARIQKLIFHQVHKFAKQYGGEFDELLGEAHEWFVRGHQQCERGVTATGLEITDDYPTVIRRWVWYGMFETMRLRANRNRIAPTVALDVNEHDRAHGDKFDVNEFTDELSWRGRKIAKLILDPPPEMLKTINDKGGTPRNYRSTVRAHLMAKGWDAAWINEGFAEIKKVLG